MALVRIGGEADKLGNHYEALWRLKLLLELFIGDAEILVLESFDRAQSQGVDAEVRRRRGDDLITEFHSVKRQCTEGIWKPSRLAKRGDHPPLLPLRDRILEDPENRFGCFVSTDPVESFRGLVDAANRSAAVDVLKERLRNGSRADRVKLGGLFNDLVGWWRITEDECLLVLKRLHFRCVDEPELAEKLTLVIEREVMRLDGTEVDANAVAQHLAEMMRLHLGQPITRQMVFDYLRNAHPGYCGKDLGRVPGAVAQLEGQNARFVREAQSHLIRGQSIPREDTTSAVRHLTASLRHWVMLTGDAGTGKSVVLAQLVDELNARQIPCLAFRFDTASPVDSMAKLKELLEIKWTPVHLLESIAQRQRCVLIIDQVDALSDVAGRRNGQQWNVLHQVLDLARACQHMSIVLACRSFDLRTDADLRLLLKKAPERRDWPEAVTIEVRPLSHECVKECLSSEGVDTKAWTKSELAVLSVPLHLGLFLECKSSNSTPVASLGALYDRYLEKLRLESARASPPWGFDAALTPVVECFNEHQRLTLNWKVIEASTLRIQAQQLISCGVLSDHSTGDARVVRFFHSTLLDHVIGRLFISGGKRLIDELCAPGERQELSRREHCRQVLSVLRKGSPKDHARYLEELGSLLTSPKVRVHLRLYLIHWLNALPDPNLEEWQFIQDCANTPPDGRATDQQRMAWRALIIRSGTWSSVPWFDLLNSQGVWLRWLTSMDPVAMPQLPWMLGRKPVLKARSNEIVEMLRSEPWASTVQGQRCMVELICGGEFYTSESTAQLFADAFTLDWPGLVDAGMWKHHLKDLANVSKSATIRVLRCIVSERLRFKQQRSRLAYEPRPLNCLQKLRERWDNWFDARKWDYILAKPTTIRGRVLLWLKDATRWVKSKIPERKRRDKPSYVQLKGLARLRSRMAVWLFPPADPHRINTHCLVEFLTACAEQHPLEYCKEAAGFIERIKANHGDVATGAITHLWMPHGGRLNEISGALIHGLRIALTKVGKASPSELDELVDRLLALNIPGLDNLVMQVWAGCPEQSVNRVASFLKASPQRLFAQPSMWSGGNALSFYARTLLKATAPLMSNEHFAEVERLVLETEDPRRTSKALRVRSYDSDQPDLNDPEKRKQHFHYLKWRHSGQHLLLSVLPSERLSVAGRKKLTVWGDQYGEPDLKPPSDLGARLIGTPSKLSDDVLLKMHDSQLLEAMRSYPPTRKPDEPLDWSQSAIVSKISKLAASQKARFLGILRSFPSDIDESYRHAIIEGLLGREHDGFVAAESNELSEAEVTELITALAPRAIPTIAKHICWSLSRKLKSYPSAWLDVLIELALHHADPAAPGDDENISVRVAGQRVTGDEVHTNGLNVVRGAACHALATALFSDKSIADILRPHVPSLLGDRSNAVRSAMIELLLAWLNVSRDEAVSWFIEIVKDRDVLLHCRVSEHFLIYACHSHLDQLGPLIDRMSHMMDDDARTFGVHQSIRAAFGSPLWIPKAEKLLAHESALVRVAAVETVVDHWPARRFRQLAERWISQAFADSDEDVQQRAAHVFAEVPPAEWHSCDAFVRAFAESPAILSTPEELLWKINDAKPVPVDLILHIVTKLVTACKEHINAKHRLEKFHSVTHEAPKLVHHAYHNAESDHQRTQCLDLLDAMLAEGFYGIKELVDSSSASTFPE